LSLGSLRFDFDRNQDLCFGVLCCWLGWWFILAQFNLKNDYLPQLSTKKTLKGNGRSAGILKKEWAVYGASQQPTLEYRTQRFIQKVSRNTIYRHSVPAIRARRGESNMTASTSSTMIIPGTCGTVGKRQK
jgi:hypothetical protein